MDEDVYRMRVDTTDIDKASDALDDVLRKLEKLTKKTIRPRPGEIEQLNKEKEALEKVLASYKNLGVVQQRVSQDITQSVNVNRTARAAELRDLTTLTRASETYSQQVARQNALQEDKRDLIEDLIDKGQVLTKSEREVARSMGLVKDQAGSIEEMTDKNFAAWQKLQRSQREAYKMVEGVWKKTADFDFLGLTSGKFKGFDKIEKEIDKLRGASRDIYTKAVKPKYAPEGAPMGLPGFENADYLYGQDINRTAAGLPKTPAKVGNVATAVPQGRKEIYERVHMMAGDLSTRFTGVGGLLKEMSLFPNMETRLRAITDMYFGTMTLKPDELEQMKEEFKKINPKTGEPYGMDFGVKPHPVHAGYMLRDLLKKRGLGAAMPKPLMKKWYSELTGEEPDRATKNYVSAIEKVKGIEALPEMPPSTPISDKTTVAFKAMEKMGELRRTMARQMTAEDKAWATLNRHMSARDLTELQADVRRYAKTYGSMREGQRWEGYQDLKRRLVGASKTTGMSLTHGSSLSKLNKALIGTLDPEMSFKKSELFDRFGGIPANRMEHASQVIMGGPVDKKMDALKEFVKPRQRPMNMDEMQSWAQRSGKGLLTEDQIKGSYKGPATEAQLREYLKKPAPKTKTGTSSIVTAALVNKIVEQRAVVEQTAADFIRDEPVEVSSSAIAKLSAGIPGGARMPMNEMVISVQKAEQRLNQQVAERQKEHMDYIQELLSKRPTTKNEGKSIQQAGIAQMGALSPSITGSLAPPVGPGQLMYMRNPWNQLPKEMLTGSKAFQGMPDSKIQQLLEQIANILPPTTDLHKFISQATSSGWKTNTTPQGLLEAANARQERYARMYSLPEGEAGALEMPPRRSGIGQFMGQGPFQEGLMGRMQKMLGVNYKVKLAFTDFEDFTRAQEILQQMPGFIALTTKELEGQGGVEEDITHEIIAQGKVRSEEDIAKLRYGTKFAGGGKSAIPERASLEVDNRRVSLSEKLFEYSGKLDKLNWKLVRGQMAMLGMYFSMMSVTNMISRAWQQLGGSISNLETTFKNIGEAIAFGPKVGPAANLVRGMLRDSKNVVNAWKEYKGLTATINTMLAYVAYKIFSDKRVVSAITDLLDKVATKLSDPGFIERIITLVTKIIEAIPTIVDFFMQLVGWLTTISSMPGFSQLVASLMLLGVAAAFLMPILAGLGGIVEALSWAFGLVSKAFDSAALRSAMIAFKDTLIAGWVEINAAMVGAGQMSALGWAVSILAGLAVGFGLVYLGVQLGLDKILATWGEKVNTMAPALMDLLKILTAPFGMLGVIILDLVRGQMDRIIPDIEVVFLKTVQAILRSMETVFNTIPLIGGRLALQAKAGQAAVQLQLNNLGGNQIPMAAEGGYVGKSGVAVIHKGEQIVPADQVQSGTTNIYNYNTVTVNNRSDEKYLEDMLGRGYYRQAG